MAVGDLIPQDGPALARDGMDRAVAHAERTEPDWLVLAWRALCDFASVGVPFTSDDVWQSCGKPADADPRALGGLFHRASRRRLIVGTGRWVNCRTPSRHAAPVREWIGAPDFERAASAPPWRPRRGLRVRR